MILITGATGYIGSHSCVELLNKEHQVLGLDNFSNSQKSVINDIETITNKKMPFIYGDIRDQGLLESLFKTHDIDAVIHFAGFKAVGESVENPLKYYENNIAGTINLLKVMAEYGVKKMIFSSSATVYGENNISPLVEEMPMSAVNPYGNTKKIIEEILMDLCKSDPEWQVIALRYFNPVGAHESGLIGEEPNGRPNNLMPFITNVGAGKYEQLNIFGGDYPTPDGTCVRDYIHVVDLAKGHVAAVEYLNEVKGYEVINLGTGQGTSVLGLVKCFEETNKIKIPHTVAARRQGDIAECYANVSKSEKVLKWKTEKGISEMCKDAWRWEQSKQTIE